MQRNGAAREINPVTRHHHAMTFLTPFCVSEFLAAAIGPTGDARLSGERRASSCAARWKPEIIPSAHGWPEENTEGSVNNREIRLA